MTKENTVEIGLHYGALSNPLEVQLNRQGVTLGEKQEAIDKLYQSLILCRFHLLTDAQYQSCLKKFHKKVMSNLKPLESNKEQESSELNG